MAFIVGGAPAEDCAERPLEKADPSAREHEHAQTLRRRPLGGGACADGRADVGKGKRHNRVGHRLYEHGGGGGAVHDSRRSLCRKKITGRDIEDVHENFANTRCTLRAYSNILVF